MADQDTSLPVRTQADGPDERLHVKVVDGTSPSVNQMQVDADKAAKTLATGHDPGGVNRTLRTSERGAMTPDGLYDATNNTVPGNTGLIASSRNAAPSDTTQTQRLTAVTGTTPNTVRALDIALHDALGNPFSETNALPVTVTESSGTAVNDYKDAASIAAAATDNHDYTVTALKTLYLTQVEASASGKAKMVISVETGVATGVFTPKWTQFNSTSETNMHLTIKEPIAVAAGVRVRVALTNRDNQAQDLYSTISGHEV